jgi:hypothetical protein
MRYPQVPLLRSGLRKRHKGPVKSVLLDALQQQTLFQYLEVGGYAAYEKVGGLKLVHACCWTHAGRTFFEVQRLCPSESVTKGIVRLIDQLFAIDAQARAQNCDWAARDALRQQARPLVKEAA